ncbi:MAG: hypothetical protein ACOYBT_10010 [Polynucleobacter sp.]
MIQLDYPPRTLSPNGRAHWRRKAADAKKHREWARLATIAAKPPVAASGPIGMVLTFYPGSRRNRDQDNALASAKPLLDGIADALGVNDSRFAPRVQFAEPVKNPRVIVTFDDAWQPFGAVAARVVADVGRALGVGE